VNEPVLTSVGEELVNLQSSFAWSVISDHEDKFGSEVGTQESGQSPHRATSDVTMQFVAALEMDVCYLAFEMRCQG